MDQHLIDRILESVRSSSQRPAPEAIARLISDVLAESGCDLRREPPLEEIKDLLGRAVAESHPRLERPAAVVRFPREVPPLALPALRLA